MGPVNLHESGHPVGVETVEIMANTRETNFEDFSETDLNAC